MNQITKTFTGNPISETGVKISLDWDRILPAIKKSVMLRPDEIIEGLTIDETTIKVSIGRKRGRKVE